MSPASERETRTSEILLPDRYTLRAVVSHATVAAITVVGGELMLAGETGTPGAVLDRIVAEWLRDRQVMWGRP